ncbi:MAG TPA: hypothetical protein VLW50_07920 [Streptosporangiaceae bacterium]|nr:hypothetical protein [Streptosporangiaceae bacterium]
MARLSLTAPVSGRDTIVTAMTLRQLSSMAAALDPATGRDWPVRAGTLEWDCWRTAEHIGDCLLSYACQIVARPAARYLRAMASAGQDASPAEVAVGVGIYVGCWSP